MTNQQKPAQPQVPVELSDDQLELVSGGNGTPEMPMKKPGGMGKLGKAGIVGAGLLGVGALTEGAIGLHQNHEKFEHEKKVEKEIMAPLPPFAV